MSDSPEITEEIVEQYGEVVEQVVESLTKMKLSYAALGATIGAAMGAVVGFGIAYRKAETKYIQQAEDEIAEMRAHYQAKTMAAENTIMKPELDAIVAKEGYGSSEPPMGVTPPASVIEAAEAAEAAKEAEVVSEDKEEIARYEEVRNVFRETKVEDHWDYQEEKARRTPVRPYVIHVDEREELPYPESTLTYYQGDDVLCREDDEVVSESDRERMVGDRNLDLFGHGSGDANVVYIRNDVLEMQWEICKSPNTYVEEVVGITHAVSTRRTREREPFDDE